MGMRTPTRILPIPNLLHLQLELTKQLSVRAFEKASRLVFCLWNDMQLRFEKMQFERGTLGMPLACPGG